MFFHFLLDDTFFWQAEKENTTGKDASLSYVTSITDNNGRFMFDFLTAKNRYFSLDVLCDSGMVHKEPLDREQLKHIDLYLHK